jgi:hypothetical protein
MVVAVVGSPSLASAAEKFCTPGSGAENCATPFGVAVGEATGNVYVVDRDAARVKVFEPDGDFLFEFGGSQLANPTRIAIDNDPLSASHGDVYVIDGFRVVKFDEAGSFLLQFGSQGSGSGQFSSAGNPVATGPGGKVYVCDAVSLGNEVFAVSVEKFEPSGTFVEAISLGSTEKACDALAVDPAGDIYALLNDFNAGVRKYSPSGTLLYTLDPGASTGTTTGTKGLAVDASGHVFAVQLPETGPRVITEWDSSGVKVSRFGYGEIRFNLNGLAVRSATRDVFASEQDAGLQNGGVIRIPVPAPGPIISPSSLLANPVGSTKATLRAEINPEGDDTSYHFQYVDDAHFQSEGGFASTHTVTTNESSSIGSDFDLHPALAEIGCEDPVAEASGGECLTPETLYHFRIFATNSAGGGNSPITAEFETGPSLEITATWATGVGSDSAELHTEVNPLGIQASGHFQYIDDAHYQSEGGFDSAHTITTPELNFGSGGSPQSGSAVIHPLAENTTYHYRAVADNALGDPVLGPERTLTTQTAPPTQPLDSCSNAGFRSGASASLPDCRAYEMVSPVDKEGGDILAAVNSAGNRAQLNQAAVGGDKLTYSSYRAFGDVESAPYTSQYLAARVPGEGWQSRAISPPRGIAFLGLAKTLDTEYKAFSTDLCGGWLLHDTDPPLAPAAPKNFTNLYKRDLCAAGGSYDALTTVAPPNREPFRFYLELQGVSPDGTAAVYIANDALTANAPNVLEGGALLYGARAGAKPKLICILPGGAPIGSGGCSAGTASVSARDNRSASVSNAISDDGSRVFWSDAARGQGAIYVRKNPFGAGSECVKATAPCTVAISQTPASNDLFWTAAADGSKAIITEGGVAPGTVNSLDLQEFDVDAEEAHLIAPEVAGVLGASEDASRVYFVSQAVLTGDEANRGGEKAEAGEPNLYLYDAAGAGSFSYIATLAEADAHAVTLFEPSAVNMEPSKHIARVTPDGRRLAFMSSAPLLGYDNTDASNGEANNEVYTYEIGGDVFCVSCNPTGSRPVGREMLNGNHQTGVWAAAQIPAAQNQLYAPRMMSDDGSQLFFESVDPLVPRDTNGMQDVYLWKPAASDAACGQSGLELFVARAGGCLSLLTSGESRSDSGFVDSSATGTDVFIATGQSLLPEDPGQIDIYDVRVGGGFPSPPSPRPSCQGEACQSPPAPPQEVTPASSIFRGAGNPPIRRKARHCPKGKNRVKKGAKVRCVVRKGDRKRRHQGDQRGAAR